MINLKSILGKLMENGQKYLENLRMTLENLNNQNIANANNQTPKEDPIGRLIQSIQDSEGITNIINNSDNNVNVPKTVEGSLPMVPAEIQATVNPVAETTVVKPSPVSTTKQTNVSKVKPFTGNITPEIISQYSKQYGVPDNKVTDAILRASKTAGANPEILFKFAKAESEFDPTASAKTSSAKGLFQFLDKTWNYIMHDLGGKQNFNLTGNRKDPYENALAQTIYLNEIKRNIAPALKNREATTGELYLGHFAGPSTARKVIEMIDGGKGSVSASSVFSQRQIQANKPIFVKADGKVRSLSEVVQRLSSKVS